MSGRPARTPPVGWGIVGTAAVADRFVAPAIAAEDGNVLSAVLSRDAGRAQAFAARHGGRPYNDMDAFLADDAVQAVYVASPNGLHAEHAIAALQAGKHVLVEKPMALSLADGRAMVHAAADSDRLLGVGFHLRHKPTNQAVRNLVRAGDLGPVFMLNLYLGAGRSLYPYDTWRRDTALGGGGTLVHQGTHLVDLVRYLTGRDIVAVTGRLENDDRSESTAAAVCELEGGVLATVTSHDRQAGTPSGYTILGERAWIDAAGGATPHPAAIVVHSDGETARREDDNRTTFCHQVQDFSQAVLGRVALTADGEDGLHNIAVIEAIYASAREGRSVRLPDGVSAIAASMNNKHSTVKELQQ